jgi:hypothetical protein
MSGLFALQETDINNLQSCGMPIGSAVVLNREQG